MKTRKIVRARNLIKWRRMKSYASISNRTALSGRFKNNFVKPSALSKFLKDSNAQGFEYCTSRKKELSFSDDIGKVFLSRERVANIIRKVDSFLLNNSFVECPIYEKIKAIDFVCIFLNFTLSEVHSKKSGVQVYKFNPTFFTKEQNGEVVRKAYFCASRNNKNAMFNDFYFSNLEQDKIHFVFECINEQRNEWIFSDIEFISIKKQDKSKNFYNQMSFDYNELGEVTTKLIKVAC